MKADERTGEMRRVNEIIKNPIYQDYYSRLEELERDREFCCHQISHLLDVARIAYIKNLEQKMGIDRELIYAAAVLHDIGKALQYEEGIPHEIAGEEIARRILDSLPAEEAFSDEEKELILAGVRGHRKLRDDMTPFERLMYESDKKSRMCFLCPADKKCSWSGEKKNRRIER